MPRRRIASVLAFASAVAAPLGAQLPAPGRGSPDTARPTAAPVVVDPGSPRAAVEGFLLAARAARWDDAARYLALPPEERASAATRAQQLKAVLDEHLWFDLDALSPLAVGDTTDGLPRDREVVGEITVGGRTDPVTLVRVADGGRPRWVFSARTLSRLDEWYATVPDRWIRERLPSPLLATGPLGLLWWQWLAMIVLLPLALLAGWALQRVTLGVAGHLATRTQSTLDDDLARVARAPVTLLWALAAARLLVEPVGLSVEAERAIGMVLRALGTIAGTWLALRAVRAVAGHVPASAWAADKPELRNLAPLVARGASIAVGLVGLIALIAQFGYSVTTLLAGLGIGGIAVAFAAQKTIENLFGSVAIGVDQPIRVGDWVEVDGIEGAVEAIGFRSTRIRTLRNTLVSFPNGRLADMRMENFGARERILFDHTVGVVYGTTEDQLRTICAGIEAALRAHPLCWPDRVVVRFVRFGAYSLDIRVIAWLVTTDINEFRAAQEELLFRILAIVRDAGTSFAFPTQTVHVERGGAPT